MKQPEKLNLRKPWLVAAWPGMGHVAVTAGSYLIHALEAKPAGMIPEEEFFSIDHVDVQNGIARSGRLPRNLFFVWRDPDGKRDLLVFLGEAQPAQHGYTLCRRIVEYALREGVERVVTFAALASQMHPAKTPRVFGAVTAPDLLGELRKAGVSLLKDGQVGGLNGALLAAAAEHGVGATCLLGELPFFAASIPNPKSSHAVLDVFARMSGVPIDLDELVRKGAEAEARLIGLLEQLHRPQDAGVLDPGWEQAVQGLGLEDEDEANGHDEDETPGPRGSPLDEASARHIEDLFGAARDDRARIDELKHELDRLGVFERYEDRFLDLFRKAG